MLQNKWCLQNNWWKRKKKCIPAENFSSKNYWNFVCSLDTRWSRKSWNFWNSKLKKIDSSFRFAQITTILIEFSKNFLETPNPPLWSDTRSSSPPYHFRKLLEKDLHPCSAGFLDRKKQKQKSLAEKIKKEWIITLEML